MKKRFALLVSLLFLFSFSACNGQSEHSQLSPPVLTVKCGSDTTQALMGTYSWNIVYPDGTGQADRVSGIHPTTQIDRYTPLSLPSDATALLTFDVEPLSVAVRYWNESDLDLSDTSALETKCVEAEYSSGRISLPTDGNYIYEVLASWENGSAHYSFYIIKAA